jgi:MFS family permease
MKNVKPLNKFLVLACLYTAQTMPGHFASNAMPVILRSEGFSLDRIGFMGLIGLPWALKFLWAPLVDRYGTRSNHYRTWVLAMQLLFAATTLAVSWLNFREDLGAIAVLMTLSYAFAATQDIAVDAYAVRTLKVHERGLGNGVQTGGNMLGIVLGSSVALVLYNYTSWTVTLVSLGVFVLVLGVPMIYSTERTVAQEARERASFRDLASYFRIPGAARWTVVMLTAFGGIFSAMTMCKPLLVDLGYGWNAVSFILGFYPLTAGVPAALPAGLAIRKWGVRQVFIACCLLGFVACSFLIVASMGLGGSACLHAGLAAIIAVFAVLMTVLNTVAMDFARRGREGSDFTLSLSVAFLGGMICAVLSGVVAQTFGYAALFACSAMLCLGVCALFLLLYKGGRAIVPVFHS